MRQGRRRRRRRAEGSCNVGREKQKKRLEFFHLFSTKGRTRKTRLWRRRQQNGSPKAPFPSAGRRRGLGEMSTRLQRRKNKLCKMKGENIPQSRRRVSACYGCPFFSISTRVVGILRCFFTPHRKLPLHIPLGCSLSHS